MVEIKLRYEGNLRCSAVHAPSATRLITDAPVDNMGKGESFSPTDLLATGLGSCILTILGIVANKHGMDLQGATVNVQKEMTTAGTRRVARLTVDIKVPAELSEDQKQRLMNAAEACPVKKSLHPDIEMPIRWTWGASQV
jgi:putative redox protein